MWNRVTEQGFVLWRVKAWEEYSWLVHGFTTRDWGNLALHTGDSQGVIIDNRKKLSNALGIELASWVTGSQVHGTNIQQISHLERGRGAFNQDSALQDTDGLITDQTNVLLASFYADCVPLLFIEPQRKIIAMAHAGWRGTLGQIDANMVKQFHKLYQVEPKEIEVAIGPSIGPCCYQVGQEVAEKFNEDLVLQKEEGLFLDLWQANAQQLFKLGVIPEHLFVANICTRCYAQDFFSYRREQLKAGRMAALLYKREGF